MRLLAKCLAALLCMLLLLIAVLPMLLSAPTFQKYSLQIVNHYLPGELDAKRLHLNWFSGQRIDGLQFISKKDDFYCLAKEITTDTPLWKILFQKTLSGTTQISSLSASWKHSGENSPITVQELNGQLIFPSTGSKGVAEFSGRTSLRGDSGDFDFNIEGIEWPLTANAKNPLMIKANLVNFPVDILEAIALASKAEIRGMFRELLGERLNLSINQMYNQNQSNLVLRASSNNQFQFNLEGTIVPGDHISLAKGEFDLKLTPRLAKKISPTLTLRNDVAIHSRIFQSNIPWQLFQETKKASPFELNAAITVSALALEDLLLKNIEMKIQAPQENDTASIQVSGNMNRQDISTDFRINFGLDKPVCLKDLKECELPSHAIVSLESSQVSIPELQLKLLEKLNWNKLSTLTTLSAHITADKVVLRNGEMSNEVVLKKIDLPFEYALHGRKKNVAFQFNAVDDQGGASVSSKGALTLPAGKFNWKALSLLFSANLKQFPARELIGLVDQDSAAMVNLLLGERINGEIQVEMKEGHGPLNVQLSGSEGSMEMAGRFADGDLELTKSFTVESKFSPELISSYLKKRYPFLAIITSVQAPLKVTIKSGSVLPLDPYDPSKLHVEHGVVEIGQITVKNRGQVRDLLNLFQANSKGDVPIWFTPLYFTVEKGLVQVKRMDMLLANFYPIATWGKIDLVKNRVSLIVGITGAAMSNALNVPLDSNYMLQLSLKGPVNQPKLEKEKAAMQLGALIAQSKGTTEGLIIGTLLDLANGKLKEGKVPSPTTDPLPWGDVVQNRGNTASQEASDKSIMKQVEQQASSLINQFLNL